MLVAVAAVAVAASCAARTQIDAAPPIADTRLPVLRAHHAVDEVTIAWRKQTWTFVAHMAVAPPPGAVRVHLSTDTGLTVLDLSVENGKTTVHQSTALSAAPEFERALANDVDRIFGRRSVFALADGPQVFGRVRDDAEGRAALRLRDGSWIAALPEAFKSSRAGVAAIAVLLVDPSGRNEASVTYADFDEAGIPQSIALRDLTDGRETSIEVVSATTTAVPQ